MSSTTVYIVSGSTRGLGAALCDRILDAGHRLHSLARSEHAPQSKARTHHSVDLSDPLSREQVLDKLFAELEQDAGIERLFLINNAARLAPMGMLSEARQEDVRRSIELNLTAVIDLTIRAIQSAGRLGCSLDVLNVTSGAASRTISGLALYCSTKAALDMLTRVVASEHQDVAQRQVRLIAVSPGMVETDMQQALRASQDSVLDAHPFRNAHERGQVRSPEDAAERLLAALHSDAIPSGSVLHVRDLDQS